MLKIFSQLLPIPLLVRYSSHRSLDLRFSNYASFNSKGSKLDGPSRDHPRQKGRNGTVFRYRRRESYHETQLEGARRVTSSRRWKDGQIYYPDARVRVLLQRGNVNADRRPSKCILNTIGAKVEWKLEDTIIVALWGKFILSFGLLEDRISRIIYENMLERTVFLVFRRNRNFYRSEKRGKILEKLWSVLLGKIHSGMGFKKQIY